MYDLHDTLRFAYDLVDDETGAPVDAATATLTVTLPDQTVVAPTVTNPPVLAGAYRVDYPAAGGATVPGRYVGVWLFTLTGGTTVAHPQIFDVSAADPGFIVSLAAAKSQLNITTTTHDDELTVYLSSATKVVEHFVGPVVVRPHSQRVSARTPRLHHLPRMGPGLTPVLTVTSLTPLYTTGTAYVTAGVVVDPVTGEITQPSGSCLTGGPWTALYTAGQRIVDSNWQLGALIIIQHLWKTQRGASGLPLASDDEEFIPSLGFAIPHRARDLLVLDQRPGIA